LRQLLEARLPNEMFLHRSNKSENLLGSEPQKASEVLSRRMMSSQIPVANRQSASFWQLFTGL
jgi:hypothetical protein